MEGICKPLNLKNRLIKQKNGEKSMKKIIVAIVAATTLCTQSPINAGIVTSVRWLASNACGFTGYIIAGIGIKSWYNWNYNTTIIPQTITTLIKETSDEGNAACQLLQNNYKLFNPTNIKILFQSITPSDFLRWSRHELSRVTDIFDTIHNLGATIPNAHCQAAQNRLMASFTYNSPTAHETLITLKEKLQHIKMLDQKHNWYDLESPLHSVFKTMTKSNSHDISLKLARSVVYYVYTAT